MAEDVIRDQVLAANRAFYDALEALDLGRMEACWADGPGIACLHPGGPWQRGWEEIRSGWEAIFGSTGYIEFEIADAEVTIADPVAWVTCTEVITSAAGAGSVERGRGGRDQPLPARGHRLAAGPAPRLAGHPTRSGGGG